MRIKRTVIVAGQAQSAFSQDIVGRLSVSHLGQRNHGDRNTPLLIMDDLRTKYGNSYPHFGQNRLLIALMDMFPSSKDYSNVIAVRQESNTLQEGVTLYTVRCMN